MTPQTALLHRDSLAKQTDPSLRCRTTYRLTEPILSPKDTLCGMKSMDHRTVPNHSNPKVPQPRLAICTALPKELAACRLMLDDPEPVNPPSADDGNQYWWGTLPSRADGLPHQVLLTSLAKMGNNVSSAAVTNLIRSFSSVEYILMVGIAGGVPDPRSPGNHVRLGDVVVSNEKGVLQYDNVKMTPGHIEIRDNSPKPGATLIAAAKALESDLILGCHPWEAHLRKAKHLSEFQRPARKTDVLHDTRNQSKRIPHPKDPWRDRHPTSPRMHLAAIGSANTLLKDAVLRDQLRDEQDVRAIEMEGSGTADASWNSGREYLVIRGICDYCDTHKNDDWQHYAALVAAAYARALIENISYYPPQRIYDPGPIKNQEIDTINDRSVAESVMAVDIEQIRSELGEVYAKQLESIIEKRGRGDIDAAWEALTRELAGISESSVPHLVQARFYYHAARWAQEDEKPVSLYTQYYQTAMRLDPSFDDRTYRAFEAVTAKRIDTAIDILRPFNTESVVLNLCRHLLDVGRASEADDLLDPLETPLTDAIRRMRALCRLASRDPEGAWRMLEPALLGQKDNALFQLTAGYIAFWQAIPAELQKSETLGPVLFQPGMISFDAQRTERIHDSLEFLQAALSLVAANSKNVLWRDTRNAILAVSILLPKYHAKAIEMAMAALSDDPIAPIPAWCLHRLGTDYDWNRTLGALTATCREPLPPLWALDLLTELLLKTGKPESAWQYLERFQYRYSTDDEKGCWLERAIRCLSPLGRLAELEPRLSILSDNVEHRRLKAAYWDACREIEKTLAIAEDLVQEPGELIDHVNLIHLYGRQCKWSEVTSSASCCLHRFADAPAEVADALVRARLELNEPAAALEILHAYQSAYERDGMLDDYYARCLSVYGVVGHHQKAFDASEFLWQRHPTAQLLTQRAHLQFLLGETPHALEMLKQGVEQGYKTPQILISIARHSLSQNREEAFAWARQAVDLFPADPQVRASAMHIAFDAGHGDWASMQLATLTRDFPDSGLLEAVKLPTVLDWMRERQAQSAMHGQSFVEGRYPFHLWVDRMNGSLGAEFYWRWHYNRDHLPSERTLFPLAFGGRPASTQLVEWRGRTLIMDYTACLTAHLLKLFPYLENALDKILVPPSLLGIIQAEILRLSQNQTDRIEEAEALLARLKDGAITLLPAPNLGPGDFSGLELVDRVKWRLAEQHGLWIVDDHFATELFETGDIPSALNVLRITDADVLSVLQSSGELILEDHGSAKLSDQVLPAPSEERLKPGASLLVNRPFLERLLELNGLEAATGNFKLFCLNDIPEQLRSEIEQYRYRQKIQAWLEKLLQELKSLRSKGKLKTLIIRHPSNESSANQILCHELTELLSGAEDSSHPTWIDDRLLSSYSKIGSHSPIVGIHDVLDCLYFREAIKLGKYCECHRDLIRSGIICRLPPPEYLLNELKQAQFDPNTEALIENQPLSQLRQAINTMLTSENVLGKMPLHQDMIPEETQFKIKLWLLVDEAMALIWLADNLDYRHHAAMADWLFDCFLPNCGRCIFSEGFKNDLLKGLAFEHSLQIGLGWRFIDQPRAAKSYYLWLFNRLMPAWQNHPELSAAVLSHFTELVLQHLENLSQLESNEQLIATFVGPLIHLPPEILKALVFHQKLSPILKHHFVAGMHIDALDLFIPQDKWFDLLNSCIANGLGNPVSTTLRGRRLDVEFIPGNGVGDSVIVSGEAANGCQVKEHLLKPYARLEHRLAQHRLAWLDDLEAGGLLDPVEVTLWREPLKRENYVAAINSLYDACERSPNFFFVRAGLALNILKPSVIDLNIILPEHCEILEIAPYAVTELPDVDGFIVCGESVAEIAASVGKLAALPWGSPYDLTTRILHELSSDQVCSEEFRSVVEDLARSSFNPIVLENLLALFLKRPDLCGQWQLEKLVRDLLAVNPESQVEVAFDLYIELLHLIWNHFQLSPEFSDKSYEQRVTWAYTYADRMLESLVCQESKDQGCLTVAAQSIKEIGTNLAHRINPFEHRPEIEADVTLPSAASRWRTVISGALGVLNSNVNALGAIQPILLDMLASLLDALSRSDIWKRYEFECFALSDYSLGPRNSSINNRGWGIALEIHALLSSQEKPSEIQPRDFWLAALNEEDINVISGYLLVLSSYPISLDLQAPAVAMIDKVVTSYVFNQQNKLLFWTAALLLARLTNQVTGDLRDRLFDRALASVKDDRTLWFDVCELVCRLDHLETSKDKVVRFIAALQKLVPMLPVESKEYRAFLSFLRRIEAQLPTSSWPNLWDVEKIGSSRVLVEISA